METGITTEIEVELDARQRLPLARLIQGSQHRYRVTQFADGELLLTPVVSITERELAVLRNPDLLHALNAGLDRLAKGKGVDHEPGHFSKLAADFGDDD